MARLYVGNLGRTVEKPELEEAFAKFGEIVDVWVTPDAGFGFVEFKSESDAKKAINALDGRTMFDGQLKVEVTKRKAGAGARGRGRGGGGRDAPYPPRGGRGAYRGRGGYDRPARRSAVPTDPYSRDPYAARDPYRETYTRETYREPYPSREREDPYTRDPYARSERPRDPYARDPYARESAYARDPYRAERPARPADPYAREPYTTSRKDTYATADPYASALPRPKYY